MLAVTAPAVLLAGLEKAVTFVGAASDLAFLSAATMSATEPLANTDGGAARHGARLLLPTTVFDAMLESLYCRGGAFINLAPAKGAMPSATATSPSKSRAAPNVARFRAATAVPGTQSS